MKRLICARYFWAFPTAITILSIAFYAVLQALGVNFVPFVTLCFLFGILQFPALAIGAIAVWKRSDRSKREVALLSVVFIGAAATAFVFYSMSRGIH